MSWLESLVNRGPGLAGNLQALAKAVHCKASSVGFAEGRPTPLPASAQAAVIVNAAPYQGRNQSVRQMMRFLATHVPGDIVVAVVFGSLGTREEIPYSDFDALVVLRRETVDSRVRLVRCARALFRAQKFMFRQDPLQHHGWFVLTEGDLDDYPEHHLPVASLLGGQALCPPDGATLSLRPRLDLPLLRDRFRALCSGVRSISGRITPTSSSYLWKSLLSEFMLLPALYVQVRDGRGIAKKESFGAARVDFTASEWEIMDDVSRVRREWTLPMPRWRRWFMTRPGVVWRKAAKRLSPPPPRVALSVLTPPAMGRLVALATSMAGKLGCSA